MHFLAFVSAALIVAVPGTRAFRGYEGLHCEGKPNLQAECNSKCYSFSNSSSFKAIHRIRIAPVCVKMWTEPGCTGTPYLYTDQAQQCTTVTFPAASFSCGYDQCAE